jgi:hypothetical protein
LFYGENSWTVARREMKFGVVFNRCEVLNVTMVGNFGVMLVRTLNNSVEFYNFVQYHIFVNCL